MILYLLACAGAPSGPTNLVIISLDTMRADQLGPYGAPPFAGADPSPNLSAFAQAGIVFSHAYSQSNETLFSHGALFTGHYPSDVAPLDYDFTLTEKDQTIAGVLKQAGWQTAAFVAGGHLARIFGMDDGFSEYVEGANFGSLQETVPLALNWLDAIDTTQPFFLFVHGYDCHTPYYHPGPFHRLGTPNYDGPMRTQGWGPWTYERIYKDTLYPDFPIRPSQNRGGALFLGSDIYDALPRYAEQPDVRKVPLQKADIDFFKGVYRSAVLYSDLWVGEFFAGLAARGLDQRTVVIVVADHGEAMLDHGFFNHRAGLEDSSTHVPLMIRLPDGTAAGQRVDAPVELRNVGRTALGLVGVEAPFPGEDLRACWSGSCASTLAFSEGVRGQYSVTDGVWRLIVDGRAEDGSLLNPRLLKNDQPATDSAIQAKLLAALEDWR